MRLMLLSINYGLNSLVVLLVAYAIKGLLICLILCAALLHIEHIQKWIRTPDVYIIYSPMKYRAAVDVMRCIKIYCCHLNQNS